jgi:hypothetical protein
VDGVTWLAIIRASLQPLIVRCSHPLIDLSLAEFIQRALNEESPDCCHAYVFLTSRGDATEFAALSNLLAGRFYERPAVPFNVDTILAALHRAEAWLATGSVTV